MALKVDKSFNEVKGVWVLKLHGEIDIYTAPKFKETLLNVIEARESDIIIDGENLEYIDSTGLGVLISGLKKLKETNKNITIINLRPNISKLFEITGLNKVFIVKGV
ncbi:STAS domain-containing protein [Clostridium sp. D2Q-11]|uniref:Anti-sigma factor antagonist n=1 Tax=Anaeromonas frigoriresistens TaxID=2683708 RepID=A0A942UYH2_9FIRM|nr:STAS domain-containing protein [Anaeromonas frigoriresistens]MBS4539321.1 STAS domain-containing protein [Anaeromonas frigoriresistens]